MIAGLVLDVKVTVYKVKNNTTCTCACIEFLLGNVPMEMLEFQRVSVVNMKKFIHENDAR
eukprot:UN00661